MKNKAFIGIDNGKHGAISIIDLEKNILDCFKYDETNTLIFYHKLKDLTEHYELRAFVEKPIVVYGLAHQTAPFETVGRHKMMLEILGIPYQMGDPLATSRFNWKKIIGLYEKAKDASTKNSSEVAAANKRLRELKVQAELMGSSADNLAHDKIAYMNEDMAKMATEFRELKKKVSSLKGAKKKSVKQTSVDACLELFSDSEKFIKKSGKTLKYDDDMAEAILLAECGRTLYINGNF